MNFGSWEKKKNNLKVNVWNFISFHLPIGFIAQLVRAPHHYREVISSSREQKIQAFFNQLRT